MNSDIITTHFDYHSIDSNLLKLDILGHDDPTMIRMLEDLTGINAREIPLDSKEVMSCLRIQKLWNYSGRYPRMPSGMPGNPGVWNRLCHADVNRGQSHFVLRPDPYRRTFPWYRCMAGERPRI